jgi:hypothetical protein
MSTKYHYRNHDNVAQPSIQLVRVIRYVSDSRLDYYLPLSRARALLDEGKLGLTNAFDGKWNFAHLSGSYRYDA